MRIHVIIIFWCTMLAMLVSCKSFKQDLKDYKKIGNSLSRDISTLSNDIVPVREMAIRASEGAIIGLNSDDSVRRLDSLTESLARSLTIHLNKLLSEIEIENPGSRAIVAMRDSLLSMRTQEQLQAILSNTWMTLDANIDGTIDGLFKDISSEQNRDRINSMIASILSEQNSAQIDAFLNNAISEVSLQPLGEQLRTELLGEDTSERIDSIVVSAIRSARSETGKFEDSLGFIRKYAMQIIGLIGAITAFIVWMIWRKRMKYANVNRLLVAKIEEISERSDSKMLKKEIETAAISQGLDDSLNQFLKEYNLLNQSQKS